MCPVDCRQWAFRYLFGLEPPCYMHDKDIFIYSIYYSISVRLGIQNLHYIALHFVHALPSDVSLANPTSFPFHLTI